MPTHVHCSCAGPPGAGSVCVRLRWADLDHVRVDVEWHGLDRVTPDEVADKAVQQTAEVMDALAVRWGVDRADGARTMDDRRHPVIATTVRHRLLLACDLLQTGAAHPMSAVDPVRPRAVPVTIWQEARVVVGRHRS